MDHRIYFLVTRQVRVARTSAGQAVQITYKQTYEVGLFKKYLVIGVIFHSAKTADDKQTVLGKPQKKFFS